MDVHVRIGDNRSFTLKQAVLLYQEGKQSIRHVTRGEEQAQRSAVFVRRSVGHDRVSRNAREGPWRKHGSRGSARKCSGQNTWS